MRAGDGYSGAVTEGRQKGAGFAHERLAAWVSTQGVGGDRHSYGYLADFRVAHAVAAFEVRVAPKPSAQAASVCSQGL